MLSEEQLERAASARIRAYYREIYSGDEDDYLNEEDALAASLHADRVFLEHTDWPVTVCNDRALGLAFAIKDNILNGDKIHATV